MSKGRGKQRFITRAKSSQPKTAIRSQIQQLFQQKAQVKTWRDIRSHN